MRQHYMVKQGVMVLGYDKGEPRWPSPLKKDVVFTEVIKTATWGPDKVYYFVSAGFSLWVKTADVVVIPLPPGNCPGCKGTGAYTLRNGELGPHFECHGTGDVQPKKSTTRQAKPKPQPAPALEEATVG